MKTAISKMDLGQLYEELNKCEEELQYAYSNNTQGRYLPRVKKLKNAIKKLNGNLEEQFAAYIESKELTTSLIWAGYDGIYANVVENEPQVEDFTQYKKISHDQWQVRLSRKDIHNKAITNGFFK